MQSLKPFTTAWSPWLVKDNSVLEKVQKKSREYD
jgi:hypothetical protein